MKFTFTALFLLISLTGFSQSFDLSAYDDFLKDHVSKKGVVDFDKVLKNMKEIEEITKNIIKLLAENYPIKSINYITEPFKSETIDFADGKISLDLIEHKILRKLDDSRIHFALYSTASSGPSLKRSAYTAETVEYELGVATSTFVNDETKNTIKMSGSEISQIFEWYKEDFDVPIFINKYSNVGKMNVNTPITYKEYNWNLPRD